MVDEAFIDLLRALDRREDELVAEFSRHPLFDTLRRLPARNHRAQLQALVARVLLQRRFLSLAFAPLYDMVIDGLADTAPSSHRMRSAVPTARMRPPCTPYKWHQVHTAFKFVSSSLPPAERNWR